MYSKETTLYRAIIIAVVIIGCIIVYFILSVIRAQKRYRKLNSQNLEAVITSIEKERGRIACDLHDELGPVLSAVKFKLSSVDVSSEIDKKTINQSLFQMDGIIRKIRAIAYNFTPSALQHKGLLFAVQHYIDHYISGSGLKVVLVSDAAVELPHHAEIHAYRILQEIIYNTVKHAKATELKIEIYTVRDNCTILSCDNGVGFNYKDARRHPSGQGLQSLYNRTEVLRGEIHIESKPSKGTKYHIKFPLIHQNQT